MNIQQMQVVCVVDSYKFDIFQGKSLPRENYQTRRPAHKINSTTSTTPPPEENAEAEWH